MQNSGITRGGNIVALLRSGLQLFSFVLLVWRRI